MINNETILEIIDIIKNSSNYKNVSIDVIEKIVKLEASKYKSKKEVLQSSKTKLHQIYNIYINNKTRSESNKLEIELQSNDTECDLDTYCDKILKHHISSIERLDIYEEFFYRIFNVTGYPKKILDIACGVNPLAIRFMNNNNLEYYLALDIDEKNINLINLIANKFNLPIEAKACDALHANLGDKHFDVCFMLKFLPVLEMQNKKKSLEFIKSLNCSYIVISYPLKSVSNKNKGMHEFYSTNFISMIDGHFEILDEQKYDNEVVYIIRKK